MTAQKPKIQLFEADLPNLELIIQIFDAKVMIKDKKTKNIALEEVALVMIKVAR